MKGKPIRLCAVVALVFLAACTVITPSETEATMAGEDDVPTYTPVAPTRTPTPEPPVSSPGASGVEGGADIVSVEASGAPGAYRFAVGIRSPDTGCDQYADWWEVIGEDGELVYRRILLHSHVNEQPFVRSGGPVGVAADTLVWVRAHMSSGGYGGAAFKGSVREGFSAAALDAAFAAELEGAAPLPDGCAF